MRKDFFPNLIYWRNVITLPANKTNKRTSLIETVPLPRPCSNWLGVWENDLVQFLLIHCFMLAPPFYNNRKCVLFYREYRDLPRGWSNIKMCNTRCPTNSWWFKQVCSRLPTTVAASLLLCIPTGDYIKDTAVLMISTNSTTFCWLSLLRRYSLQSCILANSSNLWISTSSCNVIIICLLIIFKTCYFNLSVTL